MTNGYFRKGAVAAIAAAVRDDGGMEGAAGEQLICRRRLDHGVVATAPAGVVPAAVAGASYAPVVERVMPAVVTIRVEKRASIVPTDQQMPDELFRRFFGEQAPRGQQSRARSRSPRRSSAGSAPASSSRRTATS